MTVQLVKLSMLHKKRVKVYQTKQQPSIVLIHLYLCEKYHDKNRHLPIRVREKSLTLRFVMYADTHAKRTCGCFSIFFLCFEFHRH